MAKISDEFKNLLQEMESEILTKYRRDVEEILRDITSKQ